MDIIDGWMDRCPAIMFEEIILIDVVKYMTQHSEKYGWPKEKRGKATF